MPIQQMDLVSFTEMTPSLPDFPLLAPFGKLFGGHGLGNAITLGHPAA